MSNTIDDFTNFFRPDKEKQYFNIMEGPIKTHVKKASKQLKATNAELGKSLRKILISEVKLTIMYVHFICSCLKIIDPAYRNIL